MHSKLLPLHHRFSIVVHVFVRYSLTNLDFACSRIVQGLLAFTFYGLATFHLSVLFRNLMSSVQKNFRKNRNYMV